MAIAVRSTSTVAPVGTQNYATSGSPLVLPAPAGLAVGDYYVVAVVFGSLPFGSNVITPTGFTRLTAQATAGQDAVVFGRAIASASDVSAVASVSLSPNASTATRAAAVGVALTGVGSVGNVGNWVYTTPAVSPQAFDSTAGDTVLHVTYSSSSANSNHPVHGATGGTVLAQATSLTSSIDPTGETTLSVIQGGSAVTFTPNAGWDGTVSVALSASAVTPPPGPTSTIAARSFSKLEVTGTANRSTSGTPTIVPAPAGLAVGDYLMIGVNYGNLPNTTGINAPADFTLISPTPPTGAQDVAIIGKMMATSADVTAAQAGTSITAKSSTVTRVVAMAVALTGVGSVGTVGAWAYDSPQVTPKTFDSTTGDAVLHWVYTQNSSGTGHATYSSVGGGTKIGQAMSPTTTPDPSADSTIGAFIGGTGVSFSPNGSFGGNISVGLTAYVAPPAPTASVFQNGIWKTGTLTDVYTGGAWHSVLSFGSVQGVPTGGGPEPTVPSDGLFFGLNTSAMKASPRKLFAHYFQTFPISVDNVNPASDYYARSYMKAAGEGGAHAANGGFLRNRPKGRNAISGDYVYQDAVTDIRQAIACGVDGFLCDIMSVGSKGWTFYQSAFDAANEQFPGQFYVIPMIDTNGGIGSYTTAQISDAIYSFSQGPAAFYLPDGRMFVSSFKAEGKTLSWWSAIFADLKTRYGISVAFLPAYLNMNQAVNYAGQTFTYGSGYWGLGSDPAIQASEANLSTAVKNRGEKFMYPIQGQNIRNYSSVFDEAKGTAALRQSWANAIARNADYVQLVTWNDYSEGGEYNDSVSGGLTQLDISAYYAQWWKLGQAPTILRDAVYLAHRNQIAGTTPTGGQADLSAQWVRTGKSAVQNVVEVLTFLTAPASVTVTIGGVPNTFTAPAGVNAQYFPLAVGAAPSVNVVRTGSTVAAVTSPAAVLASPVKDDYQYFRSGSIRGTTGQFDPQVAYGY